MRFAIKNRIITKLPDQRQELIGDNSDYIAYFEFDDEWAGKEITARFIRKNGDKIDILLENNQCNIGVQILKEGFVKVGVFCDVMTTTPVDVYIKESIKEKDGSPLPPTPDIYQQILEKLEKKQNKLTAGTGITIDENDVISATGGGGGTSDYEQLTNKPKINDNELVGNKTTEQLGLNEATWGNIDGNIADQTDLKDTFVSMATLIDSKADTSYVDEELEKKVTNDGAGVSGALYNLNFNSEEVNDETQIIVQNDVNSFVRRKLNVIADYIKSKIMPIFVSTEPQTFTREQRIQVRENINAATGGVRRVTQDTSRIIDLTPYTSTANHFQCPCDGYLRLRGSTSGRANASVDNYTSISALNDAYNMTFVAEGAWIFVSGNPQTAQFLPIEIIEG